MGHKKSVSHRAQIGADEELDVNLISLLPYIRPDYCAIKCEVEEELIC